MRSVNNQQGSVLVFMTLMIVLLMVMVGMGMDTGQLTYTRSQGQAAVDAAALSAVSGLPMGLTADAEVKARAAAFNSKNDYLSSPLNAISGSNVTYVSYNSATGAIADLPDITGANGVRVALEKTNPYTTVAAGSAMQSPVFLTPLMKLFGQSAPAKVDVSVSAVAAMTAKPSIPIAIYQSLCNGTNKVSNVQLVTSPATTDNSCWTTYWDPSVNTPDVQDLFTTTKTCSGLPNGGSGPIYLGNGVNTPVYGTKGAEGLFSQYPMDGTKCWMVPVVADGSSCNRTDTIQEWAKICPTLVAYPGKAGGDGVCPEGGNKCIVADVTCGQSLYRTDDSLCFASRLVREPKSGTCPGCSM
jgi:Flp pilus assembly protein TadG